MVKKAENIPTRVEKHLIRPSSQWFSMFAEYCRLANNLYNHGNYLIRERFINNGEWIRSNELDKILKKDLEYPDYKAMPTAQTAQQVLHLLDRNWKSFFAAIKDWKEHKDKYSGRPKMPKYKKKNGRFVLVLTNQNCKYANGKIKFPRTFNGFEVVPEFSKLPTESANSGRIFNSFQQIRFVPDGINIVMEIVYTIKEIPQVQDNGKYAGIDIGVDNLISMATNDGVSPLIVNGKIPKSINQYYNKKLAHLKSVCKRMSGNNSSSRIRQLTAKRNRKIDDYLHKASRIIVDRCVEQGISTIVIGKNKNWKQKSKLSKQVNQNFVQLPFARLIQMIEYKAKEYGIVVILTEESYTSGTSFLDGEAPTKENYDKSRRVHRGLFKANDGRFINADINGAFQIMRKVFPNVSTDGIEGVVLRPVKVVAT